MSMLALMPSSVMEAAIVRTSAARSSQCVDLLLWSKDI